MQTKKEKEREQLLAKLESWLRVKAIEITPHISNNVKMAQKWFEENRKDYPGITDAEFATLYIGVLKSVFVFLMAHQEVIMKLKNRSLFPKGRPGGK